MKEKATFTLGIEQIREILTDYYFKNVDKKIMNKIQFSYEVIRKDCFVTIKNQVIFVIKYSEYIESLGNSITKELVITEKDLNNIINEKLSNEGYQIDTLDMDIVAISKSEDKYGIKSITYILNEKEKAKIKRKGWKKNV